MPLEMNAIVTAFGLNPTDGAKGAPSTGRVGASQVTAIHIGMGPPKTRVATSRLFDDTASAFVPVDHVMIAGICGGLDPNLAVGTLINPEFIVEHTTGLTYRNHPPGDPPLAGTLVTTEQATLDHELSRTFFEDGCIGVDMETSAVAEVCEGHGCPWSVYRCIGDRYFDGLLDPRHPGRHQPGRLGGQSGDRAADRRRARPGGEAQTTERRHHHGRPVGRRGGRPGLPGPRRVRPDGQPTATRR